MLQSDYFGKKIAGDSTDRYLKIRKDDFVYNDRTTKASSFGTIKRLSNYPNGIVSPIYKCFRFEPNENPDFWEWYFESGSHNPALGGLVNEGARAGRFNISVTQFLSTNAWRPDEAEQKKIADCLDSADALIEAQGRKVEALKAHKKGLMQQLFPQEGETQPRLRFPEFEGSGEWDEKSIGDFGQVVTGSTPSTADPTLYGGGIPFVSPADISELRYVDETKTTLTAAGFEKTRPIKARSVLFVSIGSTIGKIAQNVRHCATNQQINAVIPNAKHSDGFVYFALSNASERIALLAGRQAVPIINKSLFSSVRLLVPSLPEQKRIADCLTSLDDLIAAESQKLGTLKTHKKGLMQQLFPSVVEDDA
ncbi:restriction endonuclease subunit S [Pelagibacterium flavum]|uniref:Restriction endonuclease subunit S n=1 Tax=Pelagibacterium flavum TaxID=2984530 RepID=A0ABY6IJT9_9HYPH|nr:restriction endonuclease subunit S [Pelagibacterium sp. YIM 151497]UYQ70878.1 restriction endonuclease subunit S [Pelagibacterium sp. YIM 151497]